MKVGFTGTRQGMTKAQINAIEVLLYAWFYPAHSEFHHGDCLGADEQAARIAHEAGYMVIAHPPSDDKLRAHAKSDDTQSPKPYLERNHDIVDAVSILIACPKEAKEVLRSGTWATVRYARKSKKDIYIITPDGLWLDG